MKHELTHRFLGILGVYVVILLLGSCRAAYSKPPLCYPSERSVYIEAENAFSTNFIYGPQTNEATDECLGGSFLSLNTFQPSETGKPWQAEWVFHVPRDGSYHVWMLDRPAVGTVRWKCNDSPWTERTAMGQVKAGFQTPRVFQMEAWTRVTPKQGIKFQANRPQKMMMEVQPVGTRACYFIDAIAVTPLDDSPKGWIREVQDPVQESNPVLVISPMTKVPSIDGTFEAAVWKAAARVELQDSVTGGVPKKGTAVWVGYRPEGLYIFAECREPDLKKVVAKIKQRDGNVWEDDCLEVFLGKKQDDYGHIIINSEGVLFDEKGALGKAWNSNAQVAAGRTNSGWTVEIFLPCDPPLTEGQAFLFNVAREEKQLGELSDWPLTNKQFNSPDLFGKILLEKNIPNVFAGFIAGQVNDINNKPIPNARISWGSLITQSGKDGRFILRGPGQAGAGMIRCWVPGHEGQAKKRDEDHPLVFTLRNKTNYGIRFDLGFPSTEPYCAMVVSPEEKITGDFCPPHSRWRQSPVIEAYAARGQSQPCSVVVYARQNLGTVKVSLSELRSARGDVLPPSDLRMVRIWPQRKGFDSGAVAGEPVPELLDPVGPVEISENTFRQFWITVTPSVQTPAGEYQGTFTILPDRSKSLVVPVRFSVLSFTLREPSDKTLGAYYFGRANNWWVFNPKTTLDHYDAEFKDMRDHGVRALAINDTPDFVVRQNGKLRVISGFDRVAEPTETQKRKYSGLAEGRSAIDLDSFLGVVDLAHRYNLDRILIQSQSLKRPVGIITRTPEQEIGWHGRCQVGPEFVTLLTESVKTIDQALAGRGIGPMYYCVDDEVYWGGEFRMSGFLNLARIVKAGGGLNAITMSYAQTTEELQQLRTVVDLPVGYGPYRNIKRENAGVWHNKLGTYTQIWTPDFNFNRLFYGVSFWFSPFTSAFGFAYQAYVGDPFNDLDGSVPDMNAAYPDPKTGRPIPTLEWEGFRQGFYDLGYLNTLKCRIQELPEGPDRTRCEKARQQIEKIVMSYADSEGNLDSLQSMPYTEINTIRRLAAEALRQSYAESSKLQKVK